MIFSNYLLFYKFYLYCLFKIISINRRLYVGNIPNMITTEYISEWLYRSLEAAGGLLDPGNPVYNIFFIIIKHLDH
jgi:hypothetical protein